MNLLAFDTSTDTLSIAVQRTVAGEERVWQYQGEGGAQASAQLIPAVQSLLAQAGLRLDELAAIVFGAGPGSFTGLRTACSVAQGLGFAAHVPLLPVDSLLAVAEDARDVHAQHFSVLAALDARMDEIYLGHYEWQDSAWRTVGTAHLVRAPQVQVPPGCVLAGNIGAAYGHALPADATGAIPQVVAALPSAASLLRLAPALLAAGAAVAAQHALPHYVRDKVAQTSAERAAARADSSGRGHAP